jgi:hypothetical protein
MKKRFTDSGNFDIKMTVFLSILRLLDRDLDYFMNQTPLGWLMFSKSNKQKLYNIIFISKA